MSLEFALNLTIRVGDLCVFFFFFDHALHEFSGCTEFVFLNDALTLHTLVWLAAVETWKDEILTDFSAARCMSLASSLAFTILNASWIFFLLVFLSLSTDFDVVARSVSLHEQCFFFCFSNVLLDCSQLPSWISRMRRHVAKGARDSGPWHQFVSRSLLASALIGIRPSRVVD